jgi:hypothetical protein
MTSDILSVCAASGCSPCICSIFPDISPKYPQQNLIYFLIKTIVLLQAHPGPLSHPRGNAVPPCAVLAWTCCLHLSCSAPEIIRKLKIHLKDVKITARGPYIIYLKPGTAARPPSNRHRRDLQIPPAGLSSKQAPGTHGREPPGRRISVPRSALQGTSSPPTSKIDGDH